MENWKPVVGYEGLYEVSDTGKVRSLNWRKRGITKELFLKPHNRGYLMVELANHGKKKAFTVHRLVANAFIENPNGYATINHKDENKKNNNVDNLEWCSLEQNIKMYLENHPDRKKGSGGRRKRKRCCPIVQKTLDGDIVKKWDCARDIFIETGMSDWSISQCCRGKQRTAYGFKWQYAN